MNRKTAYKTLILPSILFLIFLTIVPLIYSLNMSFRDINYSDSESKGEFIGLSNFKEILFDKAVINSLWLTLLYLLLSVSTEIILGLSIALFLQNKIFGDKIIRSLYILPMAVPPIVGGLMFKIMYLPEFGVISYLMYKINIISDPILGNRITAFFACLMVDIWQWTPFVVLIILAGLESLPKEPYEAASVDGASTFQLFRYVTLPLLSPVILIAIVFRVMEVLKVFDFIYLLTFGGPSNATDVYSLFIYRTAFRKWNLGYAAANSYVLLVFVILLSSFIIKLLRSNNEPE